jgi:hypothetical protein
MAIPGTKRSGSEAQAVAASRTPLVVEAEEVEFETAVTRSILRGRRCESLQDGPEWSGAGPGKVGQNKRLGASQSSVVLS